MNYFNIGVDGGFKSDDQGKKITFDDVTRSKSTLSLAFADKLTTLYNPLQFHFHAPSEHTVDGKFYDLEVHFVHTLADQASGANKYTVYGVFFDVETGGGEFNPFLASLSTAIDSHINGYAQKP